MKKFSYLVLLMFLCLGFSLNAQNLTDDPAYYQSTPPSNQAIPTGILERINVTASTVLCDSGSVTLIGTGTSYSAWSTDSLGTNILTTNDTFTSGVLTSDTSFYHTSIGDSVSASPALAPQSGTFSGSVRGYYFVAPVNMVITGFWVPTDASSGVQHVEILRFGTAPPQYPALTNNFTSLGSWRSYNALDTIPANIQVFAGDTLGIYGNRADVNSYGPNNDIVIAGITTPILRSGMQFPISTNSMQDVWSEAASASISRTEFFYKTSPDTTITLHNITIGQPSASAQALTACGNISYNGVLYTSDTVLVDSLNNFSGCDSLVTTTITVKPTFTDNINLTICTGDSVIINGTTYNAANPTGTDLFNAVNGCDSTVHINLTVIPTLTNNFTATVCNNDSLVVNGTTYNSTNSTGTEVFTSVNGCDSTVSVNLNVVPVLTGNYSDTICTGDTVTINGTIYGATNPTGTEVFTSLDGCDSTVSVNLLVPTIDVSTSTSGFTITVNQTGATYQWLDCNNGNAPIAGETNSSYTATSNGDYAVIITIGSCSKTSSCINVIGLNTGKIQSETAFSVYPNPTSGQFTVDLKTINTPTTIRIFDVLGQRILTQEVQSTKTQINLNNYSNGTYFIEVNNQKSVSVNKLILNK